MNFSVIIPLFNKGPHIERALRSALDQTFAPKEVIVIDDGSTDGGLDIARRFDGVKILTRDEPGPGGYAARNLGINAATGDWIAFLDADDRWLPLHLKTLSEAVSSSAEQVGCAFSAAKVIDGARSWKYRVSPSLPRSPNTMSLGSFLAAWLETNRCPMWTGAVAIRRNVLISCGMFPTGTAVRGGDKDTWLRVMDQTNAVFSEIETVEFFQDTVNRVTKGSDYEKHPIILDTIATMLPSKSGVAQDLLRELSDLELSNYARHAARAGKALPFNIVRQLSKFNVSPALKLVGYVVASRVLKMVESSKRSFSVR